MCSTREEITEAFASLATALSRVLGLTFDALTTPERLALLEHCETARRQLPSVDEAAHENAKAFHDKCENTFAFPSLIGVKHPNLR
ncbi:hypothetical protein ABLO16_07855 [Mycobacterium tuberculosis]